ncbi:DEAD/DEAH box helicase [Fulvivirga lutea]|uniref:DEAD/DEAH box helicase n=1 Tax=Fulvivirga lutea TaxID=2810512 RepID=A0A974WG46_9BACT|nr:DEAD/DEAH box helicase [Fulvivirga lutea]QSE96517.1 DEAD/DEAH box helicase [Fulvivirga lutea]
MSFAALGISKPFIKALDELKIINPSPIQEQSIPFLLSKGTDFIAQAPTGTGKTAAYGLPLLEKINAGSPKVQALILTPTRELGQQVAKQLFKFTKYSDKIFTEAVYGGAKIEAQIAALKRPTQIIVATPGRLVDLLQKDAVDLSHVKYVVLDEADEMLSMGFKKELTRILKHTTGRTNTWLFSATMPPDIKTIIKNYLAPDAFRVTIGADRLNKKITHQYTITMAEDKLDTLVKFLKDMGEERGMIFCRTKVAARTLAKQLKAKNLSTDAIHGDLLQKERDKIMRAFKNESLQFLIATDIAARGIDVKDLAFAAHYELPDQVEYYIHRSGRTARAGNKGLSLIFITKDELKHVNELQEKLQVGIDKVVV